jgi:hypothetical protein
MIGSYRPNVLQPVPHPFSLGLFRSLESPQCFVARHEAYLHWNHNLSKFPALYGSPKAWNTCPGPFCRDTT